MEVVKTLGLKSAGLQEIEVVYLCLNFPHFPTLQVINLENNAIGDNAGCLLVTLLTQYAPQLHTLILKSTQIQVNTVAALYILLDEKQSEAKSDGIREISIAGNPLHQEELCKFLVAASQAPRLRVLDLAELRLTEPCLKLIATIIKHDKRIEDLDISRNPIGKESQRILLSSLARNSNLRRFRLCGISMGDKELKDFVLGFAYNRGVKELYLNDNSITEMEGIRRLIENSKTVELISIEGNPIKEVKAFRAAKGEIEKLVRCEIWMGTQHAYNEYTKNYS
eukprot:TRINITY_DN5053_c0_g1_i14.p2 TRINITY_DN5053_c0_g1~~TRINITY_DN5053_c0_g1_i14.p2  ORF type:complete len:281 (-),score=82.15 TRINITY_DN5053_c0_g1_i14:46-888(-)